MEPGYQILLNTFLGILVIALCCVGIVVGIKTISLKTQDSLDRKSFLKLTSKTIKSVLPYFLPVAIGIMCLNWSFLALANSEKIGTETQVIESFEIVALKTNEDAIEERNGSAVSVGFYVSFSTTTTTNDTYTVMKETEAGGYKQFSFPVEDTTIFEVSDNYRVEKVQEVNRYQNQYWDTEEEWTRPNLYSDEEIHLYIPEGSLVLNTYDAGWNETEGEN